MSNVAPTHITKKCQTLDAVFVLVVLLSVLGTPAEAQQEFAIPSEESCPNCRIELEPVVTLGGATEQEGMLCYDYAFLAADGRGRYYVAPTCTPGEILVYDQAGRVLQRLGRFGQGPGEFGDILRVWASAGGSLHVFERPRGYTILSPSYEPVLKEPSARTPHDVLVLEDGRTIQQLSIPTPDLAGLPLHIVDQNGKRVSSFGAPDATYRQDRPALGMRTVARASEDLFWSAHFESYQIELWDLDGHLHEVLSRDVSWFEASEERRKPVIQGIRLDGAGYLWIAVVLPLDTWRRGDEGSAHQHFDTMIEVIDPIRHRVVASMRSDTLFMRWVGELIYSFREDLEGNVFLDVWRARLIRPTS